ncbi:MAG: hypothetical protein A2287_10010 [Candidatus Melainabacteria bacterium RIFOXYA12_FULL_32_12]|nr:MAG: hypothetical protein A2255_00860 [Candidatus Melainabacteria bacterium RIFOXYA2_FULL_32_9]OGI31118.1 MAG: hypothetical protein A2287_10010 [Candidatus Melainabacteria bacterium RIFOXYA12_FULL_32_12]
MYLIKALKKVIKNKSILFTTPGHSQGLGILPEIKTLINKKTFKMDLSEIEGLDNLQNPTGAILKSQQKASEIYGSKASYYLVNGSSSGILALMLATVKPGEKVLIARNAHKSVINALILSGAMPVWINTEWINEWNIPGQVNPIEITNCLNNNPEIKAVWITSPTYQGVISDIATIAKSCQKKGVLLIVDEAHGSLWNFSERLPTPAIQLGADASVQSLHKNASSLTQGAILHLSSSSKIDPGKLQQCLNIINTTSPSYLILASIEATIEYLSSKPGQKKLDSLLNDIDKFHKKLSKYSDILFLQDTDQYNIDKTKILLGIKDVSGYKLSNLLQEKYNIEVEMDNDKSILALTGIGTSKKKLDKLAIAIMNSRKSLKKFEKQENFITPLVLPEIIYSPQEALHKKSKVVNIKDSIGLVAAETIVTYPPGIPIITTGEKIKETHLKALNHLTQITVISD